MNKNISNKPDIREKALKYGMGYPVDEELLMLILGTGSKAMSIKTMAKKIAEVLNETGSEEVAEVLMKMKGVGCGKALAVAAALELGKRKASHLGAHIRHPDDLVPFVKHYAMNAKEYFLVVTLNGGHNIINIHVVAIGAINQLGIQPREIFVDAIREKATAIILCHNHPSGRTQPSKEDLITTKRLEEASKIIGIPILDHIIIDCNSYFSFLENKLLPEEDS